MGRLRLVKLRKLLFKLLRRLSLSQLWISFMWIRLHLHPIIRKYISKLFKIIR